jgi:hypothetical protein
MSGRCQLALKRPERTFKFKPLGVQACEALPNARNLLLNRFAGHRFKSTLGKWRGQFRPENP